MNCLNEKKIVQGLISPEDMRRIREAVCIATEKIYDSCKEKDCIKDIQVLFRNSEKVQCILKKALSVKVDKAEVKKVLINTEPMPFKKGYYTVGVTYIIKLWLEFLMPPGGCGPRCVRIPGWVIFEKKTILFGSEGKVKIFSAETKNGSGGCGVAAVEQDNLPITKIEVTEPLPLEAKIVDTHKYKGNLEDICSVKTLPEDLEEDVEINIAINIDIDIDVDSEARKKQKKAVVVTLGLFSIIKLVRKVQLLVPAFDFCVPNKECISGTEGPCDIFDAIDFPFDQFFPPQIQDFNKE